MSHHDDMKARMAELLEQDGESWARLSGMMAVLALPPTRFANGEFYRRAVEIEISPDKWAVVDCVAVQSDRFVFWRSGELQDYVFPRAAGAPRWRSS